MRRAAIAFGIVLVPTIVAIGVGHGVEAAGIVIALLVLAPWLIYLAGRGDS